MQECVKQGVATLQCIPVLFNNVISAGIAFASLALLFFIAYSAAKFITAGSDPEKISSAKKSLTFALIGFVIIVGSFMIIAVISFITETDCKILGIECPLISK